MLFDTSLHIHNDQVIYVSARGISIKMLCLCFYGPKLFRLTKGLQCYVSLSHKTIAYWLKHPIPMIKYNIYSEKRLQNSFTLPCKQNLVKFVYRNAVACMMRFSAGTHRCYRNPFDGRWVHSSKASLFFSMYIFIYIWQNGYMLNTKHESV